jgi:hypothetical protein
LAGCASDEEVDGLLAMNMVSWVDELGEVAIVLDLRVVMREDRAWEWLNLREERWLPAERMPRDGSRLDT